MAILLAVFLTLTVMAVMFSVIPIAPGPPFAVVAILLIPLWPDMAAHADGLTWWVAGTVAALGLVITIIDLASPWLAKLYEGALGKSSRGAAIGSVVGLMTGLMLSIMTGCFGIAVPFLAALPVPLMLVTPFVGALIGESMVEAPEGEKRPERSSRIMRSAFVQWLGLLTTIVLKVGYSLLVMPIGLWLVARSWI
jgi:uncharacterized protein YqgC (DUF456 family)